MFESKPMGRNEVLGQGIEHESVIRIGGVSQCDSVGNIGHDYLIEIQLVASPR
jgi:hypothetical protein